MISLPLRHYQDCFIVLMTDGVSDVLNSAQVCAVVNSCEDAEEAAQVCAHPNTPPYRNPSSVPFFSPITRLSMRPEDSHVSLRAVSNPSIAGDWPQELVSLAAQLGSVDNITALVIRLPGWGKFENPEDTHLRHQAYTYNRGGRFRPLSML